eukprot:TRINITY_DN8115_c0_g1_i2.p1 TRINITY_DN8115_c0_g1~~TRINITY_DN8115_c0_g1_i2.p1  ORF type:complete len:211 (+),score=33.61 TRINITY_DN8115_c0_g1_i2:133-765(+)
MCIRDSSRTVPKQSIPAQVMNPWPEVARIVDDAVLSCRVESYATTFGIISALMCSISITALLTEFPDRSEDVEPGREPSSLLEQWCGVSRTQAVEAYRGAMAGSFYLGLCGIGASTVSLAWCCLHPGCMSTFVTTNAAILLSIPFFSASAVGLNALAVWVALDISGSRAVSYVGLAGTLVSGSLVLVATGRAMRANWRLRQQILVLVAKQ